MEKIGLLFPGQGAQYVGMGKDLVGQFPQAKVFFDRADKILGYPLSQICFEGPEDELTRTRYAQPAIFVVSMVILALFREKKTGIEPSFAAGLSLGEFSALVAAGSISFEDGLTLVKRRAEAMEACAQKHKGTMASIMGLSSEICFEIAKESGVQVANLNAPDQIVLSGYEAGILKACQLAESKGAKRALPLKVGGAFHSNLMAEARQELENALANITVQSPKCIFIPNATAEKVANPDEIRKLLALQLTSPVRWVETMKRAEEAGIKNFYELGPGKVLKGLAKRSYKEAVVENLGTAEDIIKLAQS